MPKRTLRFRIRDDGFVQESVEGVAGSSCEQLTEKLEESLGVVVHRASTSDSFLDSEVESISIPVEQNLF